MSDCPPQVPPTDSTPAFLKEQLEKPPSLSKKYGMSIAGIKITCAIFLVSGIALFVKPEIAAQITSLAQIAISAIGALAVCFITGQSTIDWKSTAALQTSVERKDESTNTTTTTTTRTGRGRDEGEHENSKIKPWSQGAKNEDG